MSIRVNGKDMKDAVIKTDQFEMRLLEFVPDHMKVSVKDITGHPFNFVPRFIEIVYPERIIAAKDSGIVAVGAGKMIEPTIEFQQHLQIESFITMDLRYARRKIAALAIE